MAGNLVEIRLIGCYVSHMANSVIEKEQIVTTVQKAKKVAVLVDRLITLGRADLLHLDDLHSIELEVILS